MHSYETTPTMGQQVFILLDGLIELSDLHDDSAKSVFESSLPEEEPPLKKLVLCTRVFYICHGDRCSEHGVLGSI